MVFTSACTPAPPLLSEPATLSTVGQEKTSFILYISLFRRQKYAFLSKKVAKKKNNIYVSLIGAMVVGRIIWGIVMFCIMGFDVTKFGLAAFWTGAIVNAIPGIIVQIILIPMVVIVLEKAKLMPNKK